MITTKRGTFNLQVPLIALHLTNTEMEKYELKVAVSLIPDAKGTITT